MSATNQTYGGRYAVIERIGTGGMAEVYRARDELLGREVAVKVLSERLSTDRSFVERFRREAQAAANLNHPNIVSLYDYGTDGSTNFIVMEYIDGRSLADIIRDEAPLLPERAAEIGADVAKALERAHNAGLVHRDIKPNNIMMTSTGQTKVTDFGIVRALGGDTEQQMTQTGMVIGTAAYLSPEQAQGSAVDARSDVYSLGCVLYEMLTGSPPFTGDTPLAVAYKHVREQAEPPSAVNPDVPEDLDAITMKALAKNADNRYTSSTEMREDLERFIGGQSVHATPLLGETMVATGVGSGTQVMRQTDVYAPEDEGSRSRAGWYVVIALAILAIFGLLAYLLANNFLGGDLVRVPDVVGDTEEEATQRLEDRGFAVESQERPSNKPEGDVIEQDPEGGERLEEGETVTLVVSSGAEQVEVPEVEGEKLREARELIEDAGLEVGDVVRVQTDTADPGTVLSQDPDAGEQVDVESAVNLEVAAERAVVVPDVINQSEDSAVAEIERAGLVAEVNTAPDDNVDEGLVISQDPDPGSEVEEGDTVVILVSEGPEAREMPDVTGMDEDEARSLLENEYGLSVSVEEVVCSTPTPPGQVCDQDPPEGTPVEPGDSATIYVQEG